MSSKPFCLSARSLACERGGKRLFRDISFALEAGQLLQVLGPNGSGKTTLLRILTGLRTPDEGQVLWQGQPIGNAAEDFTRHLSYIGFQCGLKADLTALENLEFARDLAGSARRTPAEALAQLGLSDYRHLACRQLSTGQVRRVALARLLMLDMALWILDEPLTGLDEISRTAFEHVLAHHLEAGGLCVLTTHHALQDRAGHRRLVLDA